MENPTPVTPTAAGGTHSNVMHSFIRALKRKFLLNLNSIDSHYEAIYEVSTFPVGCGD